MITHLSDILLSPCEWQDIHEHVSRYIQEVNLTVESFWEDHVLNSNHYKMVVGDELVGWFSIHGGSTIVLFHVMEAYANFSAELFAKVKKYESVTNAMVVTGDEFFLSHAIDNYSKLEKQAYFAIYTEKPLEDGKRLPITLRLADVFQDEETLKLGGDFLKGEIENIKNGLDVLKLYIVESDEDVVGFGVVQYGRVVSDIASIGMFVRESYRCKGYAGNILKSLKELVSSQGHRAFSGCWYYNHNSKKSMESAGAYTKTRLLRFYF